MPIVPSIVCHRWKLAGFIAAGVIGVVALVASVLVLAARHVPAFYAQTLLAESDALRRGNDELLESATALANVARRAGQWYVLLSEDQINGWLAIDLAQNHAELLPPNFVDPRIHIAPGRAVIACGYRYPGLSTVLSVTVDVYLAEPHVVAIRIHAARAGRLPVPMTPIVEGVALAAARLNLRVEWRQVSGDPVALITLPAAQTESTIYRLDAFELRDSALYLAGRTEAIRSPASPSPATPEPHTDVAARPDEKQNVQ